MLLANILANAWDGGTLDKSILCLWVSEQVGPGRRPVVALALRRAEVGEDGGKKMRIRPRQEILALWQAQLESCFKDGKWVWGGHRGSNSISDAEQLLTLLYPITEVEAFAFDKLDFLDDDVQLVLSPLGKDTQLGGALLGIVEDYFQRHTDADGEPIFAAGGYLRASDGKVPTDKQLELDVVDSYSMSVTLSIATLRFQRALQAHLNTQVSKEANRIADRMKALDPLIRVRLTLAMTGLLRSFVIHTPRPDDELGREIIRMVNRAGVPDRDVVAGLARELDEVRVQLASDVKLGQREEDPSFDLSNDKLLFECGWSWGIHVNSAEVESVSGKLATRPGYAAALPNPYFTIVALDGIADLTSQRAQEVDLLHPDQRELADALKLRWELAQRYWSLIARYGSGDWPLEDIPWRTSSGDESVYYSLAVAAIMLEDFANRKASNENELSLTATILGELGRKACIVRRSTSGDPAWHLHEPGLKVALPGAEEIDGGAELVWTVADFTTLLLKRALKAARLIPDVPTRDQLVELAAAAWGQLNERKWRSGNAVGLWDDAAKAGPDPVPVPLETTPSWYMTERVVECLVVAYGVYRQRTLATPSMISRAVELLNEADHLLNREQLEAAGAESPTLEEQERRLDQARQILRVKPGTAFSLAEHALLELQRLTDARDDAMRMS
jgi:hypothetical protein